MRIIKYIGLRIVSAKNINIYFYLFIYWDFSIELYEEYQEEQDEEEMDDFELDIMDAVLTSEKQKAYKYRSNEEFVDEDEDEDEEEEEAKIEQMKSSAQCEC